MSEQKKKIAVVGVGNILMGDEGIGVRAVELLRKKELPEKVVLFDGGTAFHALIDELVNFDKLIIVDAMKSGVHSGTICRFELEDLDLCGEEIEEKRETTLSLHGVGILETLMLEKLVHSIPEEIVFIGVEPESIEFSMELSSTLKEKLPELIQIVCKELSDCE